jgi:SAM-dependent methyltransferase
MGFSQMASHEQDALFVRHTYLVAVAEILAHLVIGVNIANIEPRYLMSGAVFRQQQIGGVVEADFFDWVVESASGQAFLRTLALRLSRFDFSHPDHDVLKVLYESVIDRETRHSLGEYYTPDWLAQQIIDATVDEPLSQRVLDPACGSGTFLFWAVRKALLAEEEAQTTVADAIDRVTKRIVGIDLHPVAVTLARVTVLLAIGRERLQQRRPFSVQVYLGDSMMWRQPDDLHGVGGLSVFTSDGETLFADQLTFPEDLLTDMARFDRLLDALTEKATDRPPGSAHPSIDGVIRAHGIDVPSRPAVSTAFEVLCRLHDERRNHIWGYYIRNLARPFYLAKEKVDRLVGNPPWLAYRYMDPELKERFKDASRRRNLWIGGTQATHQDLAGYFVARSVERFLPVGGRFGFVMPAGVLKGRQYAGFRTGNWSAQDEYVNHVDLADREPWRLVDIKPDPFPVPSCVIFGSRASRYASLPASATNWAARLPQRGNLHWSVVGPLVTKTNRQIRIATDSGSPYREDFTQGANLVPRMLMFVKDDPSAPSIGAGAGMRALSSHRTTQEKRPWKDLESLRGNVETRFVHPIHLGETLLPYRLINALEAIIPWDGSHLLSGTHPEIDLYPGLAAWWQKAEQLRSRFAPSGLDLNEQIDYRHKLSMQLPPLPIRVVYAASGSNLAAAVLTDTASIVEHALYWAPVATTAEGRYLVGILNSTTLLDEVQDYQPVGQFGPRHFDKYVFEPPFARYDSSNPTHRLLVAEVKGAERIAESVSVDGLGFQAARAAIRQALNYAGASARIDEHVLDILTTP